MAENREPGLQTAMTERRYLRCLQGIKAMAVFRSITRALSVIGELVAVGLRDRGVAPSPAVG